MANQFKNHGVNRQMRRCSGRARYPPSPSPDSQSSTEEERARLLGLARGVSNVELPTGVPIVVDNRGEDNFEPDDPPPDTTCAFTLPDDEDAIHGAMTMAMWAVPRIDPWLDLLAASLAVDRTALPERANVVSAPWWRFPPWAPWPDAPPPSDPQERLWLAAVGVFRRRLTANRVNPGELAERIADRASSFEHAKTPKRHPRGCAPHTTSCAPRRPSNSKAGGCVPSNSRFNWC